MSGRCVVCACAHGPDTHHETIHLTWGAPVRRHSVVLCLVLRAANHKHNKKPGRKPTQRGTPISGSNTLTKNE